MADAHNEGVDWAGLIPGDDTVAQIEQEEVLAAINFSRGILEVARFCMEYADGDSVPLTFRTYSTKSGAGEQTFDAMEVSFIGNASEPQSNFAPNLIKNTVFGLTEIGMIARRAFTSEPPAYLGIELGNGNELALSEYAIPGDRGSHTGQLLARLTAEVIYAPSWMTKHELLAEAARQQDMTSLLQQATETAKLAQQNQHARQPSFQGSSSSGDLEITITPATHPKEEPFILIESLVEGHANRQRTYRLRSAADHSAASIASTDEVLLVMETDTHEQLFAAQNHDLRNTNNTPWYYRVPNDIDMQAVTEALEKGSIR